MYTCTYTIPVPVFQDTDLSYRHDQLFTAVDSVLRKEFSWAYGAEVESLRGAETYEIGGQTYVQATVIIHSMQNTDSLKLSHKLTKAAENLP